MRSLLMHNGMMLAAFKRKATGTKTIAIGDSMTNGQRVRFLEEAYKIIRAERMPEAPETCSITFGFPSRGAGARGKFVAGSAFFNFKEGQDLENKRCFISISPEIGNDVDEVIGTLIHEMIHAALPKAGHGIAFKRVALRVGLAGKMTATTSGPELCSYIGALQDRIEEKGIKWTHALASFDIKGKKPGSRLIKLSCSCGRIIRLSKTCADLGDITCNKCNSNFKMEV